MSITAWCSRIRSSDDGGEAQRATPPHVVIPAQAGIQGLVVLASSSRHSRAGGNASSRLALARRAAKLPALRVSVPALVDGPGRVDADRALFAECRQGVGGGVVVLVEQVAREELQLERFDDAPAHFGADEVDGIARDFLEARAVHLEAVLP